MNAPQRLGFSRFKEHRPSAEGRTSHGTGKDQSVWTRQDRPAVFFKESFNDEDNAFTVGVGPGGCGGRLRGLRAGGWRSGLQGELPELSRIGGDTQCWNRQGNGR